MPRYILATGYIQHVVGVCLNRIGMRHYYATERLLSGVSIYTLAENMGTSVGVIQQHYGHLRPEMAANELTKLSQADMAKLKLAAMMSADAEDDDDE